MDKLRERYNAILKKLLERDATGNADLGAVSHAKSQPYDDGGYDDPHQEDDKPDFVKRDEAGWTSLSN